MEKAYAIVSDGVIVNTVLADEQMAINAGWVELIPGYGIGDIYVGGSFAKKLNVEGSKITPLEFLLLFLPQERIAVKALLETDPVVKDFYDIANDARLSYIDLSHPMVSSALDYFVSINVLTTERKQNILNGILA